MRERTATHSAVATKERLARALEAAHAPQRMVDLARQGYYDDDESPLDQPIQQLVEDCETHGLYGLADQARRGDFDGSRPEVDAWMEREGQHRVRRAPRGRRRHQQWR